MQHHINVEENIRRSELSEPVCRFPVPVATIADSLPGVQYRDELDYYPEFGLTGVRVC